MIRYEKVTQGQLDTIKEEILLVSKAKTNDIDAMRYLLKSKEAHDKIPKGNYSNAEWIYQYRVNLFKQRYPKCGFSIDFDELIQRLVESKTLRNEFFSWLLDRQLAEYYQKLYQSRWMNL